jgi:hypothetical protein
LQYSFSILAEMAQDATYQGAFSSGTANLGLSEIKILLLSHQLGNKSKNCTKKRLTAADSEPFSTLITAKDATASHDAGWLR